MTPTPGLIGKIVIYPNPVLDSAPTQIQLTLGQTAEDLTVMVFTTAFRKINEVSYGAQTSGPVTISLATRDQWDTPLANGLYYLVLKTPRGRLIGKLIVSR